MSDRYAVFGHPIGHSKSPRIHRLFAEQTRQKLEYTAQDVPDNAFQSSVKNFFDSGGKGLNCTVPLKELAWKFADNLSERARLAKAVNTLAIQSDGKIFGDNTDGIGLIHDLNQNHSIVLHGTRVLILGAGGACRGIILPLLDESPEHIVIANRSISKAETIAQDFAARGSISCCEYAELDKQQFDLIINATSASLSDQLPPLPNHILANSGCCYDLAYGNQPTSFVRWGLMQNAHKSLDGLGMLVEQAAEAFALWRGIRPHTASIISLLNQERKIRH